MTTPVEAPGTLPGTADSDATTPADAAETLPESVRRLACLRCTHESHENVGSLAPADPLALARALTEHDRVTEAVVLSTCNRVEVYASTRTPADREAALRRARALLGAPADARTHESVAVVRHLGRVACGLESRVLGEDHVLGQVRRAFESAADAGLAGGVLSRAADAAVRAGRDCREATAINEGHVGYGEATCESIADATGEPDRLVVVGAGEMARSVVKAATHRWAARVDVVNRSPVSDLPAGGGQCFPLAALGEVLAGADAVVTATGAPDPVVTAEDGRRLAPGTPVVDLANPPDVAETVRAGGRVAVTDLSAVQTRVDANAARRERAVPAVGERLDAAVERFVERERENRAEDTLRALHRRAATVREDELERALNRLEDGDADAETVLADFASALTGSLLGTPTERLRAAARDGDDAVIEATHRLFDLDEPDGAE